MKRSAILATVLIAALIGIGAYIFSRPESQQTIVTSADNAPSGSIHNLPVPQAVATVRSKVAAEKRIPEGEVIVLTAYEKQWPDGCLGLANPGEICAQTVTPGYEVTVQASGQELTYRTDTTGRVIRAEQ